MAIALVDVNNFYASCERLFRPELRGLHIPADHEHRFRFNVNTISGPM